MLDLMVMFVMIFSSPMSALAAPSAQETGPLLETDKAEYLPGETVYVSGSGFTFGDYILATLDPGGNVTTWATNADEAGYILYSTVVTDLLHELDGVTDTQGPAVDLLMLREFVRTHATGVAPTALDHLVAAIDAQLDDLMADSRRAGRDVYRRKPRKFARRLTKAVRRDLAPPAAAEEDITTD